MLSAEVFEKTMRYQERRAAREMQAASANPSPSDVSTKSTATKYNNDIDNHEDDPTGRSTAHPRRAPGNRGVVRSIRSGTVAEKIQRFTTPSSSPPLSPQHPYRAGSGGNSTAKGSTTSPRSTAGRSPFPATTPGSTHPSRSRRKDRWSSAKTTTTATTTTTPDHHGTINGTGNGTTTTMVTTAAATTSAERSIPRAGLTGFAMRVSNAYKRECTSTTTQTKLLAAKEDPTTFAATFVTTPADESKNDPSKEPRPRERTHDPPPPPPPPPRRPPQTNSPEKKQSKRQPQRLSSEEFATTATTTTTDVSPNQAEDVLVGNVPNSNPPRRNLRHHREGPAKSSSLDHFQSPKGVIAAAEAEFSVREPSSETHPTTTSKSKIADAIMGFTHVQIRTGLRNDPQQSTISHKDDPLNSVVAKLDGKFSIPKITVERSPTQKEQQPKQQPKQQEQDSIDSFLVDHYYETAVANSHLLSPSAISVQKGEKYSRSNLYNEWAAITDGDNDADSMEPSSRRKRWTTSNAKTATLSVEEQLDESKQVIKMLFRDLKVSKKHESDLRAKLHKSRLSLQNHHFRYEENMKIAIKSADDVRANLQRLEDQRAKEKAKAATEIARIHQKHMEARQECLRWKLRALEQHPYRRDDEKEEQQQQQEQHRQMQMQMQVMEEVMEESLYGDGPNAALLSAEMTERDTRNLSEKIAIGDHGVIRAQMEPPSQDEHASSFEEGRPDASPKLAAPQSPRESVHLRQPVVVAQQEDHVQQRQQQHQILESTTSDEDVAATTTAAEAAASTRTTFASSVERASDSYSLRKSSSDLGLIEEIGEIGAPQQVTNFSNEKNLSHNGSGGNSMEESKLEYNTSNSERFGNYSKQLTGLEFVSTHSLELRAVSASYDDDENTITVTKNGGNDEEESSQGVMLGGCGGGLKFSPWDSDPGTASASDQKIPEATAPEPKTKTNAGSTTRRATLNDLLRQLEASKKRLQAADQKWNGLVSKGGDTLNCILSARTTCDEIAAEGGETSGRNSIETTSSSVVPIIDKRLEESNAETTKDSKSDDSEGDQSRKGGFIDGSINVVDSLDDSIEVSHRNYAYV